MNKALKAVLIVLAVIIVLGAAGAIIIPRLLADTQKNLEALSYMQIEDVDLSAIPDGTYEGSYEAFPVAVEVEVTVENQTITDIELIKHTNGQGGAAEVITEMVVNAQSLQVDAISGATYSSKVIILAIEDALKSAAENN